MNKIIVYLALFFMILPCYADSYLKIDDYLYFDKDTFKTDYIANSSACFAYKNKEKAKITGKVFTYEAACYEIYGGESYVKTSYYFFTPHEYIKSDNSYYFNRLNIWLKANNYLHEYTAKYLNMANEIRAQMQGY